MSLSSIIKIIDIYDNDYLVGSSFLAYHYFRMAELFNYKNGKTYPYNSIGLSEHVTEFAKKEFLNNYSTERNDYTTFSPLYNYELAAKHYDKAIKLHSAGSDYKSSIMDTYYLEDDLNDASYHFGAAMDRYLMVNNKLQEHYRKCKIAINKLRMGSDDYIIS